MKILTLFWLGLGTGLTILGLIKGRRRLQLSMAKHRSLVGHVRMGKRFAGLIPFYEYDESKFFQVDDAPAEIVEQRKAGFHRLAELNRARCPKTLELTKEARAGLSDLQFTATYRVPFQFSRIM